jgi:hypothetical protein
MDFIWSSSSYKVVTCRGRVLAGLVLLGLSKKANSVGSRHPAGARSLSDSQLQVEHRCSRRGGRCNPTAVEQFTVLRTKASSLPYSRPTRGTYLQISWRGSFQSLPNVNDEFCSKKAVSWLASATVIPFLGLQTEPPSLDVVGRAASWCAPGGTLSAVAARTFGARCNGGVQQLPGKS